MRKIIILSVFTFLSFQSFACPYCGCGVGNFYMGMLPDFKTRFIGVRYQYMQYHTQVTDDASQFGNDYYSTVELWSGFNIGHKWQVIAFAPYHFNKQVSDDGTKTQNGLGDISLIVNYRLFQSAHFTDHNTSTQQQLWIGGGIKLPTGKNSVDINNTDEIVADANSQMGTGSVDFLLNAAYNLRINKFGVNTSVNYKINSANNAHYIYGNRFSASSIAYYRLKFHGAGIAPNIGVLYEHANASKLTNAKVQYSGGFAALASGGTEISLNKISVGLNAQLPFSQNFAAGQTTSKFRGMMHVSFSF